MGGLGEVLGVMLTPKMAANLQKIEKKCGSKRQAIPEWFFDGFLVEDSKISSQGDPNSVFEPRNPSVKCISAFSAQTQNFVRVGC